MSVVSESGDLQGSLENDVDSESDVILRPTKRTRKESTTISRAGSAFGIMSDMWRDFQAIIDEGCMLSEDDPSTLSYQGRKYAELYSELLHMAPEIGDLLRKGVSSLSIARELDHGRTNTRGSDIHGIKLAIGSWDVYIPQLNPDSKATRGFHHPECGRLLCPVTYDWNNREVRAALQNGSSQYPAGATDWPRVLWANEDVDDNDMMEGFLRNTRLVRALRHSLLGPSAGRQSVTRGGSRRPKAAIHGIKKVTVPAIAYSAVLVHYALNSQESFSAGQHPGQFPYEAFYQSLVKFVEVDMSSDKRKDLLDWWTRQVFGRNYEDARLDMDPIDDADDHSNHENGGRRLSVMARMKAQAAEANTHSSRSVGNSVLNERSNRQ